MKYRIVKCSKTEKQNSVLQVKDGQNWLCLHNDNMFLDKLDILKYKLGFIK